MTITREFIEPGFFQTCGYIQPNGAPKVTYNLKVTNGVMTTYVATGIAHISTARRLRDAMQELVDPSHPDAANIRHVIEEIGETPVTPVS